MDFSLLLYSIQHDWMVLLPIVAASVLVGMVAIERSKYFNENQRDLESFVQRLQRELYQQKYDNASLVAEQLGGLYGQITQEGVTLLQHQPQRFTQAFEITIGLALRKLEKGLNLLGTVGTVAPYLGLFGTVVRILLTFGDMAKATGGNGAEQVMFGIGSALIATAFGLGVAILAVVLNNHFRNQVEAFENDFQLIKLVLLSSTPASPTTTEKLG
ncbi:MAG: MotA/TolQ/ExbB proton channel family protein [Vampirovibrionales bacterium]